MGHFCDSPESPNPLEINSIQKQQHCASTNFSSVHCLSFNHLQKVCQPIVPNIPSKSKFPGRLQRFYQVLSMPLLKPSWLVKQPVILASHGIIAPPMTWSGLHDKRDIRGIRRWQNESARSRKQCKHEEHGNAWPCIWKCDNVPWTWCNVSISWSLTMTSFINKRDIYTWNHTDSLRNSTQSNSLLQVVHLPSNVPWNMSLHS